MNGNRKEDKVYEAHQVYEMNMDDNYQELFLKGKVGQAVMEDLRLFCKYDEMCIGKDNDVTNQLLGSRRVFVFIRDRINHKYTKSVNARKQKESISNDKREESTKG